MKNILEILILGVAVPAFGQFGNIPGDGQIYDSRTQAAIDSLQGSYRKLLKSMMWPSVPQGAQMEWQLSAVPAEVVSHGTLWVRRIIKPNLLPGDLSSRWRAHEGFIGSDCLGFRYVNSRKVQIVETGSAVVIVVSPIESLPTPISEADAIERINRVATELFNLPEPQSPVVHLRSVAISNGANLWHGYVERGRTEDAREWQWWTLMSVMTDGSTVAFIVSEVEPSVGASGGGATASNRHRFRGRS
ncbi:MAG: hypothetical protein M3R13_05970 [Armatimonadota bacterium]|nr:hypothetical protein [Armatimonadota bacterium]